MHSGRNRSRSPSKGRGSARLAQAREQDQAYRAYVQEAAHGSSTADDLVKLSDLRDRGVITEADFQQGKDKILKSAA